MTGPRCDVCARGYSGTFPDCQRCHQCFSEWDAIVGQLTNQTHRLVNKVKAVKQSGAASAPYRSSMDSMERSAQDIRALLNSHPAAQPLSEIQELLQQASELMGALTQALNSTEQALVQTADQDQEVQTRLDTLSSDSHKLERTVRELIDQVEFIKNSDVRGATASVNKYYLQSQGAEARANASTVDPNSPVETSAKLRKLTEDKLNQTAADFLKNHTEHAQRLDDLAGELQSLDLSELSQKTCGSGVSQDACSSSPCGGLGCLDSEGRPKCGGEGCGGLLSSAKNTWTKARDSEQELLSAIEEVERLSKMVSEAKVKADEAKLSAQDVLLKTNRTKNRVEQSNQELRGLIKQIRDFLTQDAADLESIELVANEVLAMQMPTSPEQLQNLTEEIRLRVQELGSIEDILEQSSQDIQRAEGLLGQARQASSEAADVKDSAEKVKQALEQAQKAQTSASKAVKQATQDIQTTNKLLSTVESETAEAEQKLSQATERVHNLEQNVTLLRDKALNVSLSSERTKEDAAAIEKIADQVKKDLDSQIKDKYSTVEKLVDEKAGGLTGAKKRAEALQKEAKDLLLQASNKLQLLKDLEKSYEDNQKTLEQKAEQLVELESAVKELLQEISQKVTVYSTCLL